MSLDGPEFVRAQYGTEEGLEACRSVYANQEGDDAREVTLSDAEAIRRYVLSMITIVDEARADGVPVDVGPVRAGTRVTVFVAKRA